MTAGQQSVRPRRDRPAIREELIEAAIVEFASKGFDGASTRTIAAAADAHQPQILYHFDSKRDLWNCAVDLLFQRLSSATSVDSGLAPAEQFVRSLRKYIEFTASNPQLTQLMTHEAGTASDRLTWLTERHVRSWYSTISVAWQSLRDLGVAAPIDADLVFYAIIGSASLRFQNAAEAEILSGTNPASPDVVERLVAGLTATFLPGYTASSPTGT